MLISQESQLKQFDTIFFQPKCNSHKYATPTTHKMHTTKPTQPTQLHNLHNPHISKNDCAYKCDMTSWDFTFLCIYKFKGQWVYYPPKCISGHSCREEFEKNISAMPPQRQHTLPPISAIKLELQIWGGWLSTLSCNIFCSNILVCLLPFPN